MESDETKLGGTQDRTAVMDPPHNQEPETAPAGPARDQAGDGAQDRAKARQDVKKAEFQPLGPSAGSGEKPGMDLLLDVTLPVSVELGRTKMTIKEVLATCPGTVIELDRAAGEPVDVLVSGKVIGRGEVVVVEEKFGVRISELMNRGEGIKQA
jgi:flagellar motor switch protein FliN/FliY